METLPSSQPSHALAAVLIAVAVAGAITHIIHARDRRNVYLTHPPGSIAASTALAYHAGFGELLLPYDDDETMARKLRSLRLGFEPRTGAIYAEDLEDDRTSDTSVDRSPPVNEKFLVNPHDQPEVGAETLINPHPQVVEESFDPYRSSS